MSISRLEILLHLWKAGVNKQFVCINTNAYLLQLSPLQLNSYSQCIEIIIPLHHQSIKKPAKNITHVPTFVFCMKYYLVATCSTLINFLSFAQLSLIRNKMSALTLSLPFSKIECTPVHHSFIKSALFFQYLFFSNL